MLSPLPHAPPIRPGGPMPAVAAAPGVAAPLEQKLFKGRNYLVAAGGGQSGIVAPVHRQLLHGTHPPLPLGARLRSHAICARADWRDSTVQDSGLVVKADPRPF
jgi:hypothetical protein